MDIEALSDADWNYLLGMYFADGNRNRKYEIKFCLQGNETDIAEKLTQLLKRTGLSPHVVFGESGKDDIIVRAYSTRLVDLLPNKKTLMSDPEAREEFFDENKLFIIENGIPFLAGLLDGDGCCPIFLRKRHGVRGEIDKWGWSFRQTRLPFLIDYVTTFVHSIAPNSLRVTTQEGGRKQTIRFRKLATIALLDAGLARYSCKVARWCEKTTKIADHVAEYITTGEIARILNVSDFTVRKWISTGKLKSCPKLTYTTEKHWKHVSREELERFREIINEQAKIIESAKKDSVRLADVAKTLGVSYSKLYNQHRLGRLQATLIRQMGSVHTYLVMQSSEAQKLMNRILKERKKVENIKSKGLGIRELAEILGVKPNTLYATYRRGGLKGKLVNEPSGKGHRHQIVPKREADRLKMKYQALDRLRIEVLTTPLVKAGKDEADLSGKR